MNDHQHIDGGTTSSNEGVVSWVLYWVHIQVPIIVKSKLHKSWSVSSMRKVQYFCSVSAVGLEEIFSPMILRRFVRIACISNESW